MCSKIDDIIIIRSCYLSEHFIRFMSSGLNKLSVHPKRDAAIPPILLFFFYFPGIFLLFLFLWGRS